MSVAVADCFKLFVKFSNFKGNSDIERYQMANKKIPFKYTRPVEDWLQEKGKSLSTFQNVSLFIFLSFHRLVPFQPLRMKNHPLNPFKKSSLKKKSSLLWFVFLISSPFLSLSSFKIVLNHGVQLKGLGRAFKNHAKISTVCKIV